MIVVRQCFHKHVFASIYLISNIYLKLKLEGKKLKPQSNQTVFTHSALCRHHQQHIRIQMYKNASKFNND